MPILSRLPVASMIMATALLADCGGGGGPAISATPQTISFAPAPTLAANGTATVSATSSSGLVVSYSTTPGICSVVKDTGVVTATAPGKCTIAADQSGNTGYAPAKQVILSLFYPYQSITFAAAPTLNLLGSASVTATANSGLAITYGSITPTICSVDPSSGLVTDFMAGDCVIAANQSGGNGINAAAQVTQTLTVAVPAGVTVPAAPTVSASLGTAANTVVLSMAATDNGSPITGYRVTGANSGQPGITATSTSSPLTMTCPSTCAGYAFSVIASNAVGDGPASAMTHVLTRYNVVETFHEPDTQPRDSIFTGSFTLDTTTQTVTNLAGTLTESMTGTASGSAPYYDMTQLSLTHQLAAVSDGNGGLLVTTFLNNNTNTFTTNKNFGGTDGWAPGTGSGLYYGFPSTNPGNAYAMIYVNLSNPTAAPTPAQISKLAYADCAPGGMMGATCMTGTTVAGYGSIGTMSGYPVSQSITRP